MSARHRLLLSHTADVLGSGRRAAQTGDLKADYVVVGSLLAGMARVMSQELHAADLC